MSQRPKPSLDGEEIAIVLVGDLNPKIFQPSWFALEDLLRRSEAEQAEIEIVHRDVASFRLDWCVVEVTRDRFLAKTTSFAHRMALRDLAVGTFSRLSHTPTRQLGINFTQRLRFASVADWHDFGHFLAPKSPWKGLLSQPGMRIIRLQGARPDDAEGFVLVTVEPTKPGHVSVQVNDHFEVPKEVMTGMNHTTAYFVETVGTGLEGSLGRAQRIVDGLIGGFMQEDRFDDGTD